VERAISKKVQTRKGNRVHGLGRGLGGGFVPRPIRAISHCGLIKRPTKHGAKTGLKRLWEGLRDRYDRRVLFTDSGTPGERWRGAPQRRYSAGTAEKWADARVSRPSQSPKDTVLVVDLSRILDHSSTKPSERAIVFVKCLTMSWGEEEKEEEKEKEK